MSLRKLNLGCGPVQPDGWINVDGSNRAWLAKHLPWVDQLLVWTRILPPTEFNPSIVYADLTKRFPWADRSIDCIYLGWVLEHLTKAQGDHVFRESLRTLKPGGVLRVRLPDNFEFWERYVEEVRKIKERPPEEWTLDHTRFIRMFFEDICIRHPLFRSMAGYHKWAYDEVSLLKTLESIGFDHVRRRAFRDSQIPDVDSVELYHDLIVEGQRPAG